MFAHYPRACARAPGGRVGAAMVTWLRIKPSHGAFPRKEWLLLLAEEHRDALDLVASGVDAGRVSAGSAVDAVADAVAREEAV